MKKSLSKRIKITGTGKLIRRSMAVNHFRTRKSTKNIRQKKKNRTLDYPRKEILSYLASGLLGFLIMISFSALNTLHSIL